MSVYARDVVVVVVVTLFLRHRYVHTCTFMVLRSFVFFSIIIIINDRFRCCQFYTVTSHLIFACAISSSIWRKGTLKTGVVAILLWQTLGYVDVSV